MTGSIDIYHIWAILIYTAKDCKFLKLHLESDSSNTYLSPQIQNEIITICGDVLNKKLVDIVNESKCFLVTPEDVLDEMAKKSKKIVLS